MESRYIERDGVKYYANGHTKGIVHTNSDASNVVLETKLNNLDSSFSTLQNTFTAEIQNLTVADPSSAEIVAARGGKATLGAKITDIDSQLAEKAKITDVNTQLASVASGSPKGVYATLALLQAAYPTGNTNIYVVTADGKWYYWNGSSWAAGGVYQSSPTINNVTLDLQTTLSGSVVTDIIYGNKEKFYGYTGQDDIYASVGTTRIHNQQILENMEINKISLFSNISGSFKILELTRNIDGTFNFKKILFSGYALIGYNEYPVDLTICKESYLGYYSNVVEISTTTAGIGGSFGCVGEVTGNTHAFAVYAQNYWNFAVHGNTVGVNSVNEKITEIYDNKLIALGNPLSGTGSGAINYTHILGQATLRSGKIKSVNIKTLGAGVAAIIYFKKLDNGNFKFVKQLGEFAVVNGNNSITVEDYIEKDTYIGYYSQNAVLAFGNNSSAYKFSGYSLGQNIAVTITSAMYAINAEIEYEGLHDVVTELHGIDSDTLEGTIFDIGSTITSDFYNDGGWVDNLCPVSANSIMYFNKHTGFDKWIGRTEINLRDSANLPKLVMCQGTGGIYVTFDLSSNKIQIHSDWNGIVSDVPAVLVEGAITVPLTQGNDYVLTIEKDTVKHLIATIYNKVTAQSFSVDDITTGDTHMHGDGVNAIGLIHKAGSYYRNRLTMSTNQNTRPRLMIYGDSYIVGYNLIRYGFDINYRYATLINNALNGNVSISAKGGEDTNGLLLKLTTDLQMIKPKYTLLAIGLNDDLLSTSTFDQFKVNMSKLINAVRINGSIPILVTYPRLNGTGIASQMNSWVRNYSGCKYVDWQLATSLDGTIGGVPDTANYFLADGHPNVAGNQRYFDKFKLDCPYVFYEQ